MIRTLRTKKHLFLLGVCLAITCGLFFVTRGFFNLSVIKLYSDELTRAARDHYGTSVVLYMSLYAIGVALSLPFAALFTLVGGLLFGTVLGTLYTIISATIGAVIGFLLIRYAIGIWIQRRYQKKLAAFNAELQKGQANYLLVLHLIPIIPFPLINILAGLTDVSLITFLWTTAIGLVPISLMYAYAGQQLTTIGSVKELFTAPVMLCFTGLALCALLPVLFRFIKK